MAPAIGAGFVGVAGGVAVSILTVVTQAYIGSGANINAQTTLWAGTGSETTTNSAQSVNVVAFDRFEAITIAGGIAGGFVGVAGGVNVGGAYATVQAFLGGGTVRAANDVSVLAGSTKDVQVYVVSAAGGVVGLAAAVAVWSIGVAADGGYSPNEGVVDRGAFSGATATHPDNYYKAGDMVTVGTTRYTAKVDHASDNGGDDDAPNANSDDWGLTDADALDGEYGDENPQDSIGAADTVASGESEGGAVDWAAIPSYTAGTLVTRNDNQYRARVDTTPGYDPDVAGHDDEWASVAPGYTGALGGTTGTGTNGSETKTNSRMNTELAKANSSLTSSAKGSGFVSGAISTVPDAGTTATVDAIVIAGDAVTIRAIDTLDVFGLAGSLAGGLVGIGASVLVMNVESVTDAGVGPNGQISAGGAVTIAAKLNEETTTIAINGTGGFVAVGAVVAVLDDTGSQTARIDDGAAVHEAGGGLTVRADADRTMRSYNIVAAIGAIAVGASVATTSVSGDATARIGNVLVGDTGSVHSIQVIVDETIDADNFALAVGIGAVAVTGALAFTNLDGKASASSGAHGFVGTGGVSVIATGTHLVHTQTLNVNGGAISFGLTLALADNARSTEALVTSTGNITFVTPPAATPGAVVVKAESSNLADTSQLIPQINIGAIAVSVMVRLATVSGYTRAQVDGDFAGASSITVQGIGWNRANAPVISVGFGLAALTGVFGSAEVTSSADIEAIVGSGASLGSTGQVKVEAKVADGKQNFATASAASVSGGLVTITALITEAIVAGRVRAENSGSVTGSSSIVVNAVGNNKATATTVSASIAAGTLSAAGAYAEVTDGADVEAIVGSGSFTSSGTIVVTANGTNYAKGDSDAGAGGLVAISISVPTSKVGGAVTAEFGADVTNATGLTVSATSDNTVVTTPLTLQFGLFTGAGTEADAEITAAADTTATVTSDAQITAPGAAVLVEATSDNEATASVTSASVGAASLQVMLADAVVAGDTTATFDGDLVDGSTDAASLTVRSRAQNSASTDVDIFSVSILGGAGAVGTSTVSGSTEAIVGSSADIYVSGLVHVDAQLTNSGDTPMERNQAYSLTEISSVGVAVSVAIAASVASYSGAFRAKLNGDVFASGAITVEAIGTQRASASTDVLSVGLGLSISGAGALAEITSAADVEALNESGTLSSNGDIIIKAFGTQIATTRSQMATGGLLAGGVSLPTAKIGGTVKALANSNVTDGDSLQVLATADRDATATAQAFALGLGALNAQDSLAEITSSAATEATIGSGATVDIDGFVTVHALANNSAYAEAKAITIGIAVSVTTVEPVANTYGSTSANINGSIGTTVAGVGPDGVAGTIGVAGATNIDVLASAVDRAHSVVKSTTVGIISVDPSNADARTEPTVSAQFGSGNITGSGFVSLVAESLTDTDSDTDSSGGGLVNVQILTSRVFANPTVSATVLGGLVQAGGQLRIEARHGQQAPDYSDGTIDSYDLNVESITFDKDHGLVQGDIITYQLGNGQSANGETAIGGLTDGESYSVILTGDSKTIRLGVQFVSSVGDNPFEASIDTVLGTLNFGSPTASTTATSSPTRSMARMRFRA